MARPRSLFERFTNPTIPPPEQLEGTHLVKQNEHLIGIANARYGLEEYDPNLWREIAYLNRVENPFVLGQLPPEGLVGTLLRIPAQTLPDFED